MSEQHPPKRFRRGRCSASIFFNEIQKDGQTFNIPRVVFQKRYRDKDGNWQTSQSLDLDDIPRAVLCLNEAFEYLTRSND